jgi:hypothetical protein
MMEGGTFLAHELNFVSLTAINPESLDQGIVDPQEDGF